MNGNGQIPCPPIDVSRIAAEIPLWRAVSWIMGVTATAFLGLAVGLHLGVLKPSTPLGPGPLAGLLIVAVALFVGATACYAVRKGRSFVWGLTGLGLFLGPLVVLALEKRCWYCRGALSRPSRACVCGAPA